MASLLSDVKSHHLRQAVEVVHVLAAVSDSTTSFITGALNGLPAFAAWHYPRHGFAAADRRGKRR